MSDSAKPSATILKMALPFALVGALFLWIAGRGPVDVAAPPTYESALAAAREQGRLLVVEFASDSAPLAARMREDVWSEAAAAVAPGDRLVWVAADPEADAALLERLVGRAGALFTCLVDPACDAAVATLPGFVPADVLVEFLSCASGRLEEWRGARERALQSPEDVHALLDWSRERRRVWDTGGAESTLLAAVASPLWDLSSPFIRAACRERLARLLARRGQVAEASRQLDEWRELSARYGLPIDAQVVITEAWCAWVERRPEATIEGLDAVDQHQWARLGTEELSLARLVLGRALHEVGEDERSLESLEEALAECGDSALAAELREASRHVRFPPPEHRHDGEGPWQENAEEPVSDRE